MAFASPTGSPQLRPRDASGWGPGMALAAVVHLLLIGALALGVHWKIKPPQAVEAEVWTSVPQVDTPRPLPVTPPRPEVTPPPPPSLPPAKIEPKVPDIVVGKDKPQKKPPKEPVRKEPKEEFILDKPKKAPTPKETVKPEPVKPQTKAPAKPQDKTPPKPVVDPKLAAKEAAKEAAKAKAEADARAKAEAAAIAAQRRANLDRLMRSLAQDQMASAGLSTAYRDRISSLIRRSVVYPGQVPPDANLEVLIKLSPKGKIVSREVTRPSGFPDFDQAVLRALDRLEQVPPDEHGRFPTPMNLVYYRDQY